MNINLEQIDELRKRSNASYEEAKKALEECNGDMVEALIYLEREHKTKHNEFKQESEFHNFIKAIKRIIKKGNTTKFMIKKNEAVILSLPVTLVVIITVFAPHITLVALILALITGHKIRFQSKSGEDMDINKHFDKASEYVTKVKTTLTKDVETENKTL